MRGPSTPNNIAATATIARDLSPPGEPSAYTGPVPGRSAAWLARLLWEQEAGGSNPPVPIRRMCAPPCLRGPTYALRDADPTYARVARRRPVRRLYQRSDDESLGVWTRRARALALLESGERPAQDSRRPGATLDG